LDDKKLNLDEILDEIEKKREIDYQNVTRHNTDIFVRPGVTPDVSDIFERPSAVPDLSDIEISLEKNAETSERGEDGRTEFAPTSSTPLPKTSNINVDKALPRVTVTPKRKKLPNSFSTKTDISDLYTEETPKGDGFSAKIEKKTDRLESAGLHFKTETFIIPDDSLKSKAADNDKSDAEYRKSLRSRADAILNEIDSKPHGFKGFAETYHKAITGFFTKVLKQETEPVGATALGRPQPDNTDSVKTGEHRSVAAPPLQNTEPVGGDVNTEDRGQKTEDRAGIFSKSDMLKESRERRNSRRAPAEPNYRKNIADMKLDLSDKLLYDTNAIPETEEAKLRELQMRRNSKVRDFVLVGDDEFSPEAEKTRARQEYEYTGEYTSYQQSKAVNTELHRTRRNMFIKAAVLLLCSAVTVFVAVMNDFSLPRNAFYDKTINTDYFLVINIIAGITAIAAAFSPISNGLKNLFTGHPDADTPTALLSVGSLILTLACLSKLPIVQFNWVQSMVPLSCAALFFNTVGKILAVSRAIRNFKPFSGSGIKYAVTTVEDNEVAQVFTRGVLKDIPALAKTNETEFVEGFISAMNSDDLYSRFVRISMPATICASLILGILAFILQFPALGMDGILYGFSVMLITLAFTAGFMGIISVNAPLRAECEKLAKQNNILLGYEGVEEFAVTNSVLIDAETLFPRGSIMLSGIKLFFDTRIDEAILEAASLTHQAGSILDGMFYDIIRGKTELLNPVESYIFEDSMGLCGWVNNRRILLGNRELMLNHSIEGLPTEQKQNEYTGTRKSAVYLSIAGQLSAMFIVEMLPNIEVSDALLALEKRGVYIILRTVDSVISVGKLADMFDCSQDFLKLLPFRNHETFEELTAYSPRKTANAVTNGSLKGLAAIISKARKIRNVVFTSLGLQLISMILGVLIVLALVVMQSRDMLHTSFIVIYNLLFLIITGVIQIFSNAID
jgi:Cu+-exporting ATPase